jgi:hypothetical protein
MVYHFTSIAYARDIRLTINEVVHKRRVNYDKNCAHYLSHSRSYHMA